MGEIDFDGPDPIFVQAAGVLRERIRAGVYPPDRAIPSIPNLAEELGIARATAEKAVAILKDEGLVRAVVGRGTFVVRPAAGDEGQ